MKIKKLKRRLTGGFILVSAIVFICWDFINSSNQYMETGTYRYESEFDPITSPSAPVKVAIVPSDYSELTNPVSRNSEVTFEQVENMVRKAIELSGGLDDVVKKGNKVMIKPNLVEKETPSGWGTNTDVRVVKALIKIIHDHTEGDVQIIVAEGSPRAGYDDPESTTSCWEASGYRALLSDSYLSGINFSLFNLNGPYSDLVDYDLTGKGTAAPHNYKYKVHKKELEVDVYISVPVLKIHNTGITCALKNQIGTAPGIYYGYNKTGGTAYYGGLVHDDPPRRWTTEEIVDLSIIAGIDFVVVDAIMCLETNKTYDGSNQIRFNTIIAGWDPVAVDHVCTRLMCLNPDDIAHITLAEKVGLGTNNPDYIDVVGASINNTKKLTKKNTSENGIWGQSNRTWLLSKTYTASNVTGAALTNEATYIPEAGKENWSEPVYFFDDRIDLSSFYNSPTSVVSYAFTYFDSPDDMTAELWLGYGEGIVVYLNGEEVYKYTSTANYNDDDIGNEVANITLKKGKNTLMVKSLNTFGDYSFALNICEKTSDVYLNGNRVDGLKFYTDPGTVSVSWKNTYVSTDMNIYPNPCTDLVNITFQLPKIMKASLDLYDLNGRLVANIENKLFSAGKNQISWNLEGINGNKINPGIYICTLRSGNLNKSSRMIIN